MRLAVGLLYLISVLTLLLWVSHWIDDRSRSEGSTTLRAGREDDREHVPSDGPLPHGTPDLHEVEGRLEDIQRRLERLEGSVQASRAPALESDVGGEEFVERYGEAVQRLIEDHARELEMSAVRSEMHEIVTVRVAPLEKELTNEELRQIEDTLVQFKVKFLELEAVSRERGLFPSVKDPATTDWLAALREARDEAEARLRKFCSRDIARNTILWAVPAHIRSLLIDWRDD